MCSKNHSVKGHNKVQDFWGRTPYQSVITPGAKRGVLYCTCRAVWTSPTGPQDRIKKCSWGREGDVALESGGEQTGGDDPAEVLETGNELVGESSKSLISMWVVMILLGQTRWITALNHNWAMSTLFHWKALNNSNTVCRCTLANRHVTNGIWWVFGCWLPDWLREFTGLNHVMTEI